MAATTQLQTPNVSGGAKQIIPFRQATVERSEILPSESQTVNTGTQRIERTVEGSGYVYGINLHVSAITSGNSATTAFAEDGPFSALDSVVFRDVNGELVNLKGYNLYLSQVINANYRYRAQDASSAYVATTGSGGSGGSFDFWVRVPIATNRRDLLGILGNQDRAQKYALRTDYAASASIWSTAPTTLPTMTIEKIYENYSVPLPTGPNGAPQQVFPPNFGTLHFTTSMINEAVPVGGSTVNHYVRRLGNTIRWVALIFRSNGSRSTANTNAPTNIRVKLGEDTIFNESYAYRRARNFEDFGTDLPNGVIVYDNLHDFWSGAGCEMGDDYWNTQALTNMQFQIAYPSGFGSTNNTLEVLTDDLLFSNPVVAQVS